MIERKHYQNAYVTVDLDAAVARFRALVEPRSVLQFESGFQAVTPSGPVELTNRLAFVWVGDLQYELIQPVLDPIGLFTPVVPENALLAMHHSCTRVDDWDALRKQLAEQGDPVVMEGGGDELKFLYVDARPVLGHYLEYTWMTDQRWAQLGGR
jgi:hypothetical protein